MTDPSYTHLTVLLDRSGSMGNIRSDMEGAFNSLIEDQKKLEGKATVTLVQFDNEYQVVYNTLPLTSVPKLVLQPRGMTALRDALGRSINETGSQLKFLSESDRPGKVLFVVITDGLENASYQFSQEQINGMITRQRNEYDWDFIYLGANQDAIAEGQRYGFLQDHSLTYTATRGGTKSAGSTTSGLIGSFRSATLAGASTANIAYSQDDRDAADADE